MEKAHQELRIGRGKVELKDGLVQKFLNRLAGVILKLRRYPSYGILYFFSLIFLSYRFHINTSREACHSFLCQSTACYFG